MYYRRNADEDIRELEREYAMTKDIKILERLNSLRVRSGKAPIVNLKLEWGYNPGLPPTATAAWGARMILKNRGQTDLLNDRTDIASTSDEDRQRLINVLNGVPRGQGAILAAKNEIARLYRAGLLSPTEPQEFVLYDDKDVVIMGNTNGSHGYIYIVAFLKPSDWITVPTTCDSCGNKKIKELLTECSQCHKLICQDTCAFTCEYCDRASCHEHLQYAPKCESCDDVICISDDCNRDRPPKECKDCGRLFCYDCRNEVGNCPCQEMDWCEYCDSEREECEDCGETRCPCEPCSCELEEEDEDY